MIIVSRLHGSTMALNSDLIERVEATPDTVLTLVDGSKYVVAESLDEIVDKVLAFRASVVVLANRLEHQDPHQEAHEQTLHVVPDLDAED
jgi:flagellar protein FlbD